MRFAFSGEAPPRQDGNITARSHPDSTRIAVASERLAYAFVAVENAAMKRQTLMHFIFFKKSTDNHAIIKNDLFFNAINRINTRF